MRFTMEQRRRNSVLMALVLLFCLTGLPWNNVEKIAEAKSVTVQTDIGKIEVEMSASAGEIKSCTDNGSSSFLGWLKLNVVLSECYLYTKEGQLVVNDIVPVKYYDSKGKLLYSALDAFSTGGLRVTYNSKTGEYTGNITMIKEALDGEGISSITKIVLGDGSAETPMPTATPTATPTARPTATPTARPTATPTARPTATPTARPTATPTARPTATPTATPGKNLWDGVVVVVPATVDSSSDTRAKIINYSFKEGLWSGSYRCEVTFTIVQKGSWDSFRSDALLYDQSGNLLNRRNGTDGFFMTSKVSVGGTYTEDFTIQSELAGKVKKIVFQENWAKIEDWLDGVTPTATPRPTAMPTATPRVTATPRPTATPTAKPTATPRVTATPRPTATPTATPRPTATPAQKGKQSIEYDSAVKKTFGTGSFYIIPRGSFYSALQFKSSKGKVASVASEGSSAAKVTIKGLGTTKITITAPETDGYQSAKKTVTLKVVLKKPKLKVKIKKGVMTLRWGKVKGADKYEVSVEQHGVKTTTLPLTKKTKLSNTITKGKKYTIKVRAIDKSKKYPSAWSKKTLTAK